MASGTLLVLLHGPFLGPWVWTETFRAHFEARGLRCFAPDLHEAWPHAQWSPAISRLPLNRYVERLHGLLSQWPGNRILVGHSGGARIAQHLVARGLRDGLVMIAPPPVEGLTPVLREQAQHHPIRFARAWHERRPLLCFGAPAAPDPALVRQWLPHPDAPAKLTRAVAAQLRDEPFHACLQALGRADLPPDPTVATLVIGGRQDSLVPVDRLRHTAAQWQARTHVIARAGHCPQLGDSGLTVARHIERWLLE